MTDAFVGDRIAFPHLDGLNQALVAELDARTLPELCETLIGAGAGVAFEYCSGACSGMSWVRLANTYGSADFPAADQVPNRGRTLLAETFEFGIVRGMTLPDDPKEGIDPAELRATAELQLADMSALLAVICAYFNGKSIPFVIGTYTPYGPMGDCVGGSWTVTASTGSVPKPRA